MWNPASLSEVLASFLERGSTGFQSPPQRRENDESLYLSGYRNGGRRHRRLHRLPQGLDSLTARHQQNIWRILRSPPFLLPFRQGFAPWSKRRPSATRFHRASLPLFIRRRSVAIRRGVGCGFSGAGCQRTKTANWMRLHKLTNDKFSIYSQAGFLQRKKTNYFAMAIPKKE